VSFLNVDLEIASSASLAVLLDALTPSVLVLFHQAEPGHHKATLELNIEPCDPTDADAGIASFCALIDALPPSARACWNRLTLRTFDIGYDALPPPQPTQFTLSPLTLQNLARVNGSLTVTVYPPISNPEEDQPS